jgi:hypothetical protein
MTTKGRIFHKRQDLNSRMKENIIAIGVIMMIMLWALVMKP